MWDADLGHYVDPLYEQWAAEARARYRNAARGSPGETESPWWAGTKAGLYAFFVSGPRNLGVGAFNAGREAVYYVRDVGAVGADAVVTGTGALVGKSWSLGVEEWSQVGRNNQPSNPNFWSDALTNAGRAGLAAGTLGTSEIAFGTYQYAKTGDADAFQQQMGGIAAGNLAGAATIKAGQTLRTTARSNAPKTVADGKITGYTRHGLNQAIGREGAGVKPGAILDAVNNPKQVIHQTGGRIKYVGQNATVVTNAEGKVITTWPHGSEGVRVPAGGK